MSKKKFTQDIADILADDLALLESLEPGAIVRADLAERPGEVYGPAPLQERADPSNATSKVAAPPAEAVPLLERVEERVPAPEPPPTPTAGSQVERDPDLSPGPLTSVLTGGVRSAPHAVDVPSIPSGPADSEPARPAAPMTPPPAASPPTGQQLHALEAEAGSLEPPDSIAAEPMAPAPREETRLGDDQPSLPFEEVQPRADVTPQPEAARAPQAEPEPEPVSEPAAVPEADFIPGAAPELAPGPEPQPAPAPAPDPIVAGAVEPDLRDFADASGEPDPEPEPAVAPEAISNLAGGIAVDPPSELTPPAPALAPVVPELAAAESAATWVQIGEPSGPAAGGPEASAMADVTLLPDEPPAESATVTPAATAKSADRSPEHSNVFADTVTLLELSPLDGGGITEAALPGNRAGSPPAPLPARRIGWNHPVARWGAYVLVVVALTFVFLWLLVDLFHVG